MKRVRWKSALAAVMAAAMTAGSFGGFGASTAEAADHDGYTMYMIGNAHIDTAWQWPYEDTARDVLSDTFTRAVDALQNDPEAKFSMSASKHYEWVKEYYPELYEQVKELIASGQWDNPGGQVVEPDLNLPSGESLVRQSLEGQHFFEEEFGQMSTVGYVPDTFGFSGQFPQILQKSGMDYFVTTKLNWQNDGNNGNRERKSDVFVWNGISGDSVLAYACYHDYVSNYSDSDIITALDRNHQEGYDTNVTVAAGMFGSGDHGGGPSSSEYANYEGKVVDGAEVKLATITEFFNELSQEDLDQVREVDGEMYFENHRGTYTSWAQVKKYNRQNEILADQAEKAATIGNWLNVTEDADEANVSKAWDRILINQFHDVLPGSSIPYAYMDTYNDQELTESLLENTLTTGVQAMGYVADTQVDGVPVLVFNALSWARDEMVEMQVAFDGEMPENIAVYDGDTQLMTTVTERDEENNTATIRFLATDVPAVGYKVFSVEEAGGAVTSDLAASEDENTFILENDSLKVEIDKTTGNIRQVYDKKDGNRAAFTEGTGSELHVLKDAGSSSYAAWDVTREEMNAEPIGILNEADSVELIEQTAERVVVRVTKTWESSAIRQDIILDAGSDRVDVQMEVDWNENQQMLKVSFPIAADAAQASYEMAYGSLERPTTRDTELDARKFEVSGHKWADITDDDGSHGVSILNDSKYGWDALNLEDGTTRLRLSALRSPMGADVRCSGWDPDEYYIDKTQHSFTYSIYPHADGWEEADTVKEGYELNYISEAQQVEAHEGTYGQSASFASAESADNNVQLTVVKTPYDEAGSKNKLILRVYESEGKDGSTVTLTLPSAVTAAKEVNLLEHDDEDLNKEISVSGNQITFTVDKYEITTVEVTLEESGLEQPEMQTAAADLSAYYNVDGVSYNENRADGDYDGEGNTIPAELWESTVTYNNAVFELGSAEDGANNFVQAEGQRIRLPEGNYDAVYILGAATSDEAASGTFTVYQTDGTSVQQEISFASWDANLSGWDRFSNTFAEAEVNDQIAAVFTHFHNGVADRMTVDNYQYVYKIYVNSEAGLDSILLPENSDMKIMAVTAVSSEFLAGSFNETAVAQSVPEVTNLTAETDGLRNVALTWDSSTGTEKVRIYRGTNPDFEANEDSCVGVSMSGADSFTDVLDSEGLYYYKAVGVDAEGNDGPVSEVSNGIYGGISNAALTVPQENVTACHNFNGEDPYLATDGDDSTKWCGEDSTGTYQPTWLQVDLGEGNAWDISGFTVFSAGSEQSAYIASDYVIQGSNNGEEWTDLVTVTDNEQRENNFTLEESVNYRYYRIYLTQAVQPGSTNEHKNTARIYEFKIWGHEDVERVPTISNLNLSARLTEENSSQTQFDVSYIFEGGNLGDSDADTKIEWFKTVLGVKSSITGASGKSLTLSNSSFQSWNEISVRVTPVNENGTEGTPVEARIILNSTSAVDELGNIADSVLAGKPVTDTMNTGSDESGSMMVDGSFGTKWCAEYLDERGPGEAVIDLEGIYDLSEIEIFHATYGYDNRVEGYEGRDTDPNWNTRAYQLYISTDGVTWEQIADYNQDDGANKSEHTFEPGTVVGRYLKIRVTQPVKDKASNNTYALRIYEMKAAGKLVSFIADEVPGQAVSTVSNVTVIPTASSVEKGSSQSYSAVVGGTYNPSQEVTWSVEGNAASGTTIDENGVLYISYGESQSTLTVRATSVQDPSVSGTVTVAVTGDYAPLNFEDVALSDWFYDAVYYVNLNGIMTGYGENPTSFGPYDTMKRAEFAATLYRISGSPETEIITRFPDVEEEDWFIGPVSWAVEAGVVQGYEDTQTFRPYNSIQRQEMAVMLYRYAQYMGYDTSAKADLGSYADADQVFDYAREAMEWAVGSGIISGKYGETLLDPSSGTSRAECAVMLQRFMTKFVQE